MPEFDLSQLKWREGFHHKNVPVETAYEALQEFRRDNGTYQDPEDIWKGVRKDPSNALNAFYDWDETKAAEAHWRDVTVRMVAAIVVIQPDKPKAAPVRKMRIVKQKAAGKPESKTVYREVQDILQDPGERQQMLDRVLRRLIAIRNEYAELNELAIVFREIDELAAGIGIAKAGHG